MYFCFSWQRWSIAEYDDEKRTWHGWSNTWRGIVSTFNIVFLDITRQNKEFRKVVKFYLSSIFSYSPNHFFNQKTWGWQPKRWRDRHAASSPWQGLRKDIQSYRVSYVSFVSILVTVVPNAIASYSFTFILCRDQCFNFILNHGTLKLCSKNVIQNTTQI